METKQTVVRTGSDWSDSSEIAELKSLLEAGWHVVNCNPIGKKLEYILEINYKQKIYVVSLNKDIVNPHCRKLFLDKELAIKFWDKVGKDEYTYSEESICDLKENINFSEDLQ